MRIAGSALILFLLSAGAAAAASADQAPRLDAARMEALVKEQIVLVRAGRFKDALRSLDRRIAMQKTPLERADLLEAFGAELYRAEASLDQRATIETALDYLARAAMAYRLALGNDHPELATALVRQAEMERLLRPQEPGLSADVAYETAYRIRATKLGPRSFVTLSTLIPMAQLKALPSRAKGDSGKIEDAATLLRQVLEGTAGSSNPQARALHADALEALQALDSGSGGRSVAGRRSQSLPPAAAKTCDAAWPDDVMLFSGEAGALQLVREKFAKARLTLLPCGAMLLFLFAPGVDPSPVLDLLSDISAGRMKGVSMNLIEGEKTIRR
jgi:hypothetical protein